MSIAVGDFVRVSNASPSVAYRGLYGRVRVIQGGEARIGPHQWACVAGLTKAGPEPEPATWESEPESIPFGTVVTHATHGRDDRGAIIAGPYSCGSYTVAWQSGGVETGLRPGVHFTAPVPSAGDTPRPEFVFGERVTFRRQTTGFPECDGKEARVIAWHQDAEDSLPYAIAFPGAYGMAAGLFWVRRDEIRKIGQ